MISEERWQEPQEVAIIISLLLADIVRRQKRCRMLTQMKNLGGGRIGGEDDKRILNI